MLKYLVVGENVESLDVCFNKLESFSSIPVLTSVKYLNISDNEIESTDAKLVCPNLRVLRCYNNRLDNFDFIQGNSSVREIHSDDNFITNLRSLDGCINLRVFLCCNNRITSLDGIQNCRFIRVLRLTSNQIKYLDPIVYLRRLVRIITYDNPLENQTIQVVRFLNRLDTKSYETIYDNNHNTHDSNIQKSVQRSIIELLKDPIPTFSTDVIVSSNLNRTTIDFLLEYCQDKTIHCEHNMTLFDLLSYVWARIERSEHSQEMFRILEEQVPSMKDKCFTGRFNCILSILDGFYDDIRLEISDNARISAIIIECSKNIIPYDVDTHRSMSRKLLLDAGYDENTIEIWTKDIDM